MNSTDTPKQHINPDDIKPGLRVRLTQGVDRWPHFGIPAGYIGTVTVADKDSVCVKMDEHIPGAEEWDNEVVWSGDDGYHAGGTTAAYAAAFDVEPLTSVDLDIRIREAAHAAQEAFWAVVAKRFPELETGDEDPMMSFKFGEACEAAVSSLIKGNAPHDAE